MVMLHFKPPGLHNESVRQEIKTALTTQFSEEESLWVNMPWGIRDNLRHVTPGVSVNDRNALTELVAATYSQPSFTVILAEGTGGWRAHKNAISDHLAAEWERMELPGSPSDHNMLQRSVWIQRLAFAQDIGMPQRGLPIRRLWPQRGYEPGHLRAHVAHVRALSRRRFE